MTQPTAEFANPAINPEKSTSPRRRGLMIALCVVAGALWASWIVLSQVFGVKSYSIPTRTMEPAIPQDSRVLTWSAGDLEPGDIVVFETAGLDFSGTATHMIKRVVALEGTTVSFADGKVLVDGVVLDEPYLAPDAATGPFEDHPDEFTVAPGEVFVLGDNRGQSADSRVFGSIPEEAILANNILVWERGS